MLLRIKDLTVDTLIGIYAEEKQRRQKIVINAEIEFKTGNVANVDNIRETMNYHPLCDNIREFLENGNFEVIEHVCHQIGKICLSYEPIISAKVEVDKPEAPIKGIKSVSVSEVFRK